MKVLGGAGLLAMALLTSCLTSFSQTPNNYQPYSYDFYQKLNDSVYSTRNRFHSSIKPMFIDDSLLVGKADSLENAGLDSGGCTWVHRKLLHEHLVEANGKDYRVYADFIPDFQIGHDSYSGKTTWLNTRGIQIGGTIGKKFSFYSNVFENQGKFPAYLNDFINREGVVPGQISNNYAPERGTKDWAYSSAILSYTPGKYLNLTLAYDKNFIGDGYRSMLLSDVSANYPYLKASVELGRVKYVTIWSLMEDLKAPALSYENGFRKKWGVYHYLDWNISNRLSLGLFESVIWQDADSTGKRGFDFSYLNPFIFLRPVERQLGSPDNSLIGLNGKYEILNNLTVYGQFLLDEFTAREFFSHRGYWANKWGAQLGVRGANAFKVKNLNYLAEFNTARPYTYSERNELINYGHYSQSLAHPLGANFREFLTIWNYSYKRFNFRSQWSTANYGLDLNDQNFGKDIYESYQTRRGDFGNRIGQGLKTNLLYIDQRISFLLNPKTNLRVELGGVFRRESNSQSSSNTTWLTFGLRSTFRNFYYDF